MDIIERYKNKEPLNEAPDSFDIEKDPAYQEWLANQTSEKIKQEILKVMYEF